MKGGAQARYQLEHFQELKYQLTDTAVSTIKDLGFGAFLDIFMFKLHDRNLGIWAASLCKPAKCNNEAAIVFVLDENCPLVLTRRALAVLIGLPTGDQVVPEHLLQSQTTTADTVKDALRAAMKTASGKDKSWSLLDVAKACENAKSDHMLQARLFIAAVFEFGFFTSSSLYLSAKSLGAVSDIQKLVKTDWCEKLIAHMTECLTTFEESWKVNSPVSFSVSIFEILSFLFLEQQCCMTNSSWQLFLLETLSVSQTLPIDCRTQSRNDHHALLSLRRPPPSSLLSHGFVCRSPRSFSYYFLATRVIATYTASCWKMKRKPGNAQRSAGERRSAKSPKVCSISPDVLAGSGWWGGVGGFRV